MEVLLIPIFTVMAVVGLAVAVDNSTVIFDPITVPPEWENRGYTSTVVTSRLTDKIRRMNDQAESFKRGRGVRLGTDKTVTQELGSYLNLAAPIWIVRKEMGLIEFTVGGEIVLKDKGEGTYQFLLRSSSLKASVLTSTECGSIDKPDELIQLAAEEALHHAEGKAPTAQRTVNPAGAPWRTRPNSRVREDPWPGSEFPPVPQTRPLFAMKPTRSPT